MQIGKILFPVTSLGAGQTVKGYGFKGVTDFCAGCANPELSNF